MYGELLAEGVLDEIDAVCRAYEAINSRYWDASSDTLLEMIDLSTAPQLTPKKELRLGFLFLDEQNNRPTFEKYLGRFGLVETYRGIIDQLQMCRPDLYPAA